MQNFVSMIFLVLVVSTSACSFGGKSLAEIGDDKFTSFIGTSPIRYQIKRCHITPNGHHYTSEFFQGSDCVEYLKLAKTHGHDFAVSKFIADSGGVQPRTVNGQVSDQDLLQQSGLQATSNELPLNDRQDVDPEWLQNQRRSVKCGVFTRC